MSALRFHDIPVSRISQEAAGAVAITLSIPAELRERVEDVILNRRPDATDRLLEIADKYKGGGAQKETATLAWREGDVIVWDNRAVLHRATYYDAVKYKRFMQRTTIGGDSPTVEQ